MARQPTIQYYHRSRGSVIQPQHDLRGPERDDDTTITIAGQRDTPNMIYDDRSVMTRQPTMQYYHRSRGSVIQPQHDLRGPERDDDTNITALSLIAGSVIQPQHDLRGPERDDETTITAILS
ncbi:hypothetical protein J6590_060772 [Homalodisca vitripennis]|nr:hypothetical protein J6590_060772 [Homalodisca vitripennis]